MTQPNGRNVWRVGPGRLVSRGRGADPLLPVSERQIEDIADDKPVRNIEGAQRTLEADIVLVLSGALLAGRSVGLVPCRKRVNIGDEFRERVRGKDGSAWRGHKSL